MNFNVEDQVKLALDEVERTYSKGMVFVLSDLRTVSVCKGKPQYGTFLTKLTSKMSSFATPMGGMNDQRKYRRK